MINGTYGRPFHMQDHIKTPKMNLWGINYNFLKSFLKKHYWRLDGVNIVPAFIQSYVSMAFVSLLLNREGAIIISKILLLLCPWNLKMLDKIWEKVMAHRVAEDWG